MVTHTGVGLLLYLLPKSKLLGLGVAVQATKYIKCMLFIVFHPSVWLLNSAYLWFIFWINEGSISCVHVNIKNIAMSDVNYNLQGSHRHRQCTHTCEIVIFQCLLRTSHFALSQKLPRCGKRVLRFLFFCKSLNYFQFQLQQVSKSSPLSMSHRSDHYWLIIKGLLSSDFLLITIMI